MNHLVHIFRALSDESRLRIIALLLRNEELCVCEIEASTKFTQTKTSRHLSYLRKAGLVRVRRDGFWMHYSLIVPEQEEARTLLRCVTKILENNGTLRTDVKRGVLWTEKAQCCLIGQNEKKGNHNEQQ